MIEFKLPSLGADMDEGTLLEWHVKPGDTVKGGQIVALVDTTKAAIDVECWDDGTVEELVVQPGTKVPVNAVLALLRTPDETPEQAAQWKTEHPIGKPADAAVLGVVPAAAAPEAAVEPARPQAASLTSRRRISPAARRHAADLGVALEAVTGTGPDSAITVQDVERAAAQAKGAPPTGGPAASPAATALARGTQMRRTIAAAMARSKREIPHYYLATEVPLEAATRWLADQNAQKSVTERLLMAVLFIKAVAKALRKFPELNGFMREGRFEPSREIHVGVAVSLRQGGLAAPAILNTDAKPLDQLMRELVDLVKRTRAFSLRSSEMSMATVTVTNLGEQGVDSVFGVIYPPQTALVGFGAVRERPWTENGALKAVPVVIASLAADHRASDGHRGALFLAELRALLQQPETL